MYLLHIGTLRYPHLSNSNTHYRARIYLAYYGHLAAPIASIAAWGSFVFPYTLVVQ
jgi:hypothetical protein